MKIPAIVLILLSIPFCLSAQKSRKRGTPVERNTYRIIDNNVENVPSIYVGAMFDLNLAEAIGLKYGGYGMVKLSSIGQLHAKYLLTGGGLRPNLPPFGENKDCLQCPDNNLDGQTEIEVGFTKYLGAKIGMDEYNITLSSSSFGGVRTTYYTMVPGEMVTALALRVGGISHRAAYAQASPNGAFLTYGFDRKIIYGGIAKVSWGRMVIDHDKYGIRGGGFQSTSYFDVLFAPVQTIYSELNPNSRFAAFAAQDRMAKVYPLGFRVGYEGYSTRKPKGFSYLLSVEAGLRPTYFSWYREAYAAIRFGFGAGLGKSTIRNMADGTADEDDGPKKMRNGINASGRKKANRIQDNYKNRGRYKPSKPAYRFG
ncbi:MAG TPA: hypothetical protein VFV37_09540 [Luteibaculaceae bacterium]|nr:hypothetical protein [Luteibaculaceae bacterium]